MTRYFGAALAAALLLGSPVWAAESGTALKADDIRAEPFRDAKTVAALAAGDKVEVLKREGGWLQVKGPKGKGWVRMMSIRQGEARKAGTTAGGVLALASGRAGTGNVVASTGVRGLNEEGLKSAKYDAAQMQKLEQYTVTRKDAQQFAAKGKLAARAFDYLPAVK